MDDYDYLIVGQGLAGTCLAFTLQNKFKKKILVIDRDSGAECSSIAAGTFNPLVFRTFKPTWRSPELIPFLNEFYLQLGSEIQSSLINKRSVLKIFKNSDQSEFWKEKSTENPSSQFMDDEVLSNKKGVFAEYGLGRVLQSGNIDMKAFLTGFRHYLIEKDLIRTEEFDYSKLHRSGESWQYGDTRIDKVIFCEGHRNSENPFFFELPFRQTKGEVLIIKSEELRSEDIVHNNINIVPMGADTYWVGSTFDWNDLNTDITLSGKSKLNDQLKDTISVDFTILEHKAGIRPTVKDRRPILGEHAEQKDMYIFNGLGTRGVMLAPFFANHLAEHIENGSKLDPEVDISRFT